MKLFTAKLTFDGKEKNATNFLFNTVTPICHVAFIFLSFRRGKKYNRPQKNLPIAKGSSVPGKLNSNSSFSRFKIKRRGLNFATRYRRNDEKISIVGRCLRGERKKITCPLAHFLQGQYDCHVTGNDGENWDDEAEHEQESYIGLALGYGIVDLPGHAARYVPRLRPVTSPAEQWRQREA